MLKGRDILDKSVIAYDTGVRFDKVKDLIFDQSNHQLLGFLLDEAGWFKDARVILFEDVQAIGPDAVIVPSESSVINASNIAILNQILRRNNILKGTHIMTTDGCNLGIMLDLYFDERSGNVEGYEVSGGLFADTYSGRSFVPAIQTLKIGEDVAFVPAHTAGYMEEQVGGIKAVVQGASAKVQDTAQATGDKLQELGQATSQKVQVAAELTSDKLQELKASTSETVQSALEATSPKLEALARNASTSVTNAVVDPLEQKAFVLGKVAQEAVNAPSGESLVLTGQLITPQMIARAESLGILDAVYRAAGGDVAQKVGDRLKSRVASLGIEQALGKRVQQVVRTESGLIIAAPGQIVTEAVVERAKTYHKEPALLNAVGLSSGDAVVERTQQLVDSAGFKLKATTQTTGEQIRSGAQRLWEQLKSTTHELQDRSADVIEAQRIKGALGRPVTRVILDQDDNVILNVGELITHQAIHHARQAKVLDLLLHSVYTETPKLSLPDLRAPQGSQSALR